VPHVEGGRSEDTDVVIETDPTTLFCVASREQSVKETISVGAVRVTGRQADAERFLSLFSFADVRSRELEHV
jgi:hypothetical protein